MGSCKCRRNVYMLAIAFLCNFTSYMTLESMQSSLNRSTGTTALSLLYTTLVLSSLLLPPLAIAKLDCRKSLFFSILMYAIYTLANFYPKPYVLIPAAVLLGTGASVMWTAAFYYVMQVAQRHAKEKGKPVEEVTGEFFGKFTSLSHFSIILGTVFMSVVFESLKTPVEPQVAANSSTFINDSALLEEASRLAGYTNSSSAVMSTAYQFSTAPTSEDSVARSTCGLYYKLSEPDEKEENSVSDVTMYVLLSMYLAFNVVAAFLCLCLDEIKGTETTESLPLDDVCASMSSLNGDAVLRVKTTDDVKANDVRSEALVKKEEQAESGEVIEDDRSVFRLVKSTMKLIYTDVTVLLLIPFTLHYGMIQGFVRGTFNASWITCSLGIQYVAYVTCTYGAVMIIGCYSFGQILRFTSHVKIFACTMTFEVALFAVTLIWQPSPDGSSETWVYFLIPIGFGICHSSLSSQLGSVYSRFFAENKKAGTALLSVWNPMGSAIAYGLGGTLMPFHLVIIVMSTCAVGTLLYIAAERIKDRPWRKYKVCCGS